MNPKFLEMSLFDTDNTLSANLFFSAERLYIDTVLDICRRERLNVVIPSRDEVVFCLARSRDRFDERGIAVAVNDFDVQVRAMDKYRMLLAADTAGVPIPRTRLPRTRRELDNAIDDVGLPAVIKPRFSAGGHGLCWITRRDQPDSVWREPDGEPGRRIGGVAVRPRRPAQQGCRGGQPPQPEGVGSQTDKRIDDGLGPRAERQRSPVESPGHRMPAQLSLEGGPGAEREREQSRTGATAPQFGEIRAGRGVATLPAGCHGTQPESVRRVGGR